MCHGPISPPLGYLDHYIVFLFLPIQRVAESRSHPRANALRQEYYNYLLSTKQEEVAGELKEKEGDYNTAMQLYLKGGYAVAAAKLLLTQHMDSDSALIERVADALLRAKQYEKGTALVPLIFCECLLI